MGITKSNLFTSQQNKTASLFKVLAHPARIAILEYITQQDSCICNDLVDELGLAQATISQHLKELKSSGLIKGNIEGNSVCYCINTKKWNEVKNHLQTFFNKNITDQSCCS